MATSGSHGSSSVMRQWAVADNNNVFIVCVDTFNSETKTSSYSYSIFVFITNVRYLSDFSTFSVVLMAKVWLHYCHHLYCVQNRIEVLLKIVLK